MIKYLVCIYFSQRRIELESSHMGGWSCYWRLPSLDMRIKDKSRLSARKGWKGTKSQCVKIPRSITRPKTASLRPCPSLAFLPLVQALTPREQVNPDEAWWDSRAALQLHCMGWVSAGSHTLMETNVVMQPFDHLPWGTIPFHMEGNFIPWSCNKMSSPSPRTNKRSLHTHRHGEQAMRCADAQALEQSEIVLKQLGFWHKISAE